MTVALGTMLAPLNSTMIAVALPRVVDAFDTTVASAAWLVTGYLVAMASLQPIAGKIGDRLGRRRLVLVGLALFGLVSLGAAVAPNLWLLLTFRGLQGMAGALVIPSGTALVRDVVPAERRARAFGLIGAAAGVAAALGPLLGGVLIEAAGWRAIFYVNLALVGPALLLARRWLPRDAPSGDSLRIDAVGAVMLAVILGTFVWLLTSLSTGISPVVPAVAGPAVVALAVVFAIRETRHPDPIIPPGLFRRRSFAAACGAIGLGNLAMYTLLLSVPLLLAGRSGASSSQTGLVLSSLSVPMILFAPVGGRLADRFGRRLPTSAGLALVVGGTLSPALIGAGIALPALIPSLALVGAGLGLSMPGLQTTAVESVASRQAGVAAGVFSTSRYLGSIVGAAVLVAFLGADGSDVGGLA
ncbi:MAG: MFS transporter, partial [Dehalococcoidales bacterium]